MGLSQLYLLCDYTKLLSLDLSHNNLSCLYPVRLAANLVVLRAVGNKIRTTKELAANLKLEHVDLSNNEIDSLGAASQVHAHLIIIVKEFQ